MTVLDSARQVEWHSLPAPLAWRERLLGLETQRTTGPGGLEVVLDEVSLVVRRWDHVSAAKTRRRLSLLADELADLEGQEFGRTPHRVTLRERSADRVSFRCLLPDNLGGGSLDRLWSLFDDILVAVGLRSTGGLAREAAVPLLVRAVDVAREWAVA